jgi:hypothetical protein
MSDRAALYTVEVRPRRGQALPLGDIDGAGTSLQDVLVRILEEFTESSADGTRVVVAAVAERDGDDLLTVVRHGMRGIAADIVDATGGVKYRQTPDDLQLVRSGCLFRLPPAETTGRLAVHVSNGRGVKELFEQGLAARFRKLYPSLGLALDRLAEPGGLLEAVAQDRVEHISLVLREPAGKRSVADTAKWVAAGTEARLELEVAGSPIQGTLLARYLAGDTAAFREIAEFGSIVFDRVLVGVHLADGSRRVYDLAHPESGRPLTRTLAGIELDASGEPTDESLLSALRAAI